MDELLSVWTAAHRHGQGRFADAMRGLIGAARPDLLCRLPEDDRTFLDPLLFAFFTEPEPAVSLEQLLYGRMNTAARPDRITVRTDVAGAAELPGIGTLCTDRRDAALTLEFAKLAERSSDAVGTRLSDRSGPVGYTLAGWRCLPGTNVVLDERISPVLHGLFSTGGARVPVCADAGADRVRDLADAFALLAEVYPEYDQVIRESTHRVVLFSSAALNSFAAPRAHGCVFLDTAHGRGPVFHFEDLLHQCGHVAFTAMTLDTGRVLAVDPATPIGGTDASGDPRTAYVVLHAIVTERFMAEGLLRAIRSDRLDAVRRHEAAGRLGYILVRYAADLGDLAAAGVLARDGVRLGTLLLEDLKRLVAAARQHVAGLDLSGQPYNFDAGVFLARNPLPALTAGGRGA